MTFTENLVLCEQIFNGGVMMLANLPPTKEERKLKCIPVLKVLFIKIMEKENARIQKLEKEK